MRLIIENIIVAEGSNYTVTQPVIYDSPEQFLVDFEQLCLTTSKRFVTIGGNEFDRDDFMDHGEFVAPDVYTLDEYFLYVENKYKM